MDDQQQLRDNQQQPVGAPVNNGFPVTTIDGVKILDRIGSGGQGAVFLATAVEAGMVPDGVDAFAVKISPLDQLGSSLRECRIHRDVSGHSNISAFFRHRVCDNYVLLLTELVCGGDLRSVCERCVSGLPEATVAEIGMQVASALAHMNVRGVAHCDVKPDNVLVCEAFSSAGGNVVKLVDFGVATEFRVDGDGAASVPVRGGTPAYLPVEATASRPVDPRKVDSFSLGVMLCEMLTGKHPFADFGGNVEDDVVEQRLAAASRGMQLVVGWLMDNEPSRRPSAAEAVEFLRQLVPQE